MTSPHLLILLLLLTSLATAGCKFVNYEASPRQDGPYAVPFPRNDWPCDEVSLEKVFEWSTAWMRHRFTRHEYGLHGISTAPLAPLPPEAKHYNSYKAFSSSIDEPDIIIELGAEGLRLDFEPLALDEAATRFQAYLPRAWEEQIKKSLLMRRAAQPNRLVIALAIDPSTPMTHVAQLIAALDEPQLKGLEEPHFEGQILLQFLLTPPLPEGLEPIPQTLVEKLAAAYDPPVFVTSLKESDKRQNIWFWNGYLQEQTKQATQWCPTLAWVERPDAIRIETYDGFILRLKGEALARMILMWGACSCNADIELVLAKHFADLGLGRIEAPISSLNFNLTARDALTPPVSFQLRETWGQSMSRIDADHNSFCFEGEGAPARLSCAQRPRIP